MSDALSGGIVMPPPPGPLGSVPMAPLAEEEVAYLGPPPTPAPETPLEERFDDHAFFGAAPSSGPVAGGADADAVTDAPARRVTWPRVASVLVVAALAGTVGWLAMQPPASSPRPATVAVTEPASPEVAPPAATPTPAVQDPVVGPPDASQAGGGAPCVAQSPRERCVPGLPRVAPTWTPGDGLLLVVSDLPASVRVDGVDVGPVEGFVPVRLPEGTYAVELVAGAQVARMDARVQAGALNRARFRFTR